MKDVKEKNKKKIDFSSITKKIQTLTKKCSKEFNKLLKKNKNTKKIITICGVVILVIVAICLMSKVASGLSKPSSNFPIVFKTTENELKLVKATDNEDKAVLLSEKDGTGYVKYANVNDRYVLFKKSSDLYLYDAKSKKDPVVIAEDAMQYYFTENDKYIIILDSNKTLLSYNFKKKAKEIDYNVDSIESYTDNKIAYIKDGDLFVADLKAKKNGAKKMDEAISYAEISKDEKRVIYQTKNGDLYTKKLNSKKSKLITERAYKFYCGEEHCNNLYYTKAETSMDLYYYNGKKSEKTISHVYMIYDIDVENRTVLFSGTEDAVRTLYIQKANKEAKIVDDKLGITSYAKLINGEDIYYVTNDKKLFSAKVKGNGASKPKMLLENSQINMIEYKDGVLVNANMENSEIGELYYAKGNKAKKIAEKVTTGTVLTDETSDNAYFITEYENGGNLFVFNGSKAKKIDEKVTKIEFGGKNQIYYLKNYNSASLKGELYRYDGKVTKISDKVQSMAYIKDNN